MLTVWRWPTNKGVFEGGTSSLDCGDDRSLASAGAGGGCPGDGVGSGCGGDGAEAGGGRGDDIEVGGCGDGVEAGGGRGDDIEAGGCGDDPKGAVGLAGGLMAEGPNSRHASDSSSETVDCLRNARNAAAATAVMPATLTRMSTTSVAVSASTPSHRGQLSGVMQERSQDAPCHRWCRRARPHPRRGWFKSRE